MILFLIPLLISGIPMELNSRKLNFENNIFEMLNELFMESQKIINEYRFFYNHLQKAENDLKKIHCEEFKKQGIG